MGQSMIPEIEIKLHEYVELNIGKEFKFGEHDCPLFTLGAIDIMQGTDYQEQMKGLWHDQKSAYKYARKNGDIVTHLIRYGYKKINYQLMTVGDVIIMEQKLAHEKKWRSVGVCLGSKVAIITQETGVEIVAISQIPNMTEAMTWQ